MLCLTSTRSESAPVLSFNLFQDVNWDEEKLKYQRGLIIRGDSTDVLGSDVSDASSFGPFSESDISDSETKSQSWLSNDTRARVLSNNLCLEETRKIRGCALHKDESKKRQKRCAISAFYIWEIRVFLLPCLWCITSTGLSYTGSTYVFYILYTTRFTHARTRAFLSGIAFSIIVIAFIYIHFF